MSNSNLFTSTTYVLKGEESLYFKEIDEIENYEDEITLPNSNFLVQIQCDSSFPIAIPTKNIGPLPSKSKTSAYISVTVGDSEVLTQQFILKKGLNQRYYIATSTWEFITAKCYIRISGLKKKNKLKLNIRHFRKNYQVLSRPTNHCQLSFVIPLISQKNNPTSLSQIK
jgi:hypothetical protein